MLLSAMHSIERALKILNDLPSSVEKNKSKTLSSINDMFEDAFDQFAGDEAGLKKVVALKKSVMPQMEDFCETIFQDVKDQIRIVEE